MENPESQENTQGEIISNVPQAKHVSLVVLIVSILVALIVGALISYIYLEKQFAKIDTPTDTVDTTEKNKVYENSHYGFSIKYPAEWSVELNDQEGQFFTLNFFNNTDFSLSADIYTTLGCFQSQVDPFYRMELQSYEVIEIDKIKTEVFYNPDGTANDSGFYIPLMKRGLKEVKYLNDDGSCGLFFMGWEKLDETKKNIINSFEMKEGFDVFIEKVIREYETNPTIKG